MTHRNSVRLRRWTPIRDTYYVWASVSLNGGHPSDGQSAL